MHYILYILIGIVVTALVAGIFISRLRTKLALSEQEKKHAVEDAEVQRQQGKRYVEELKEQHRQQMEALRPARRFRFQRR